MSTNEELLVALDTESWPISTERLGAWVTSRGKGVFSLTADHVWNGGDFHNLKWVQQAMNEMGICYNISMRWLNSWLNPTERQKFPELEFFADSYEQISTSIDRTGLRPQLRAAFEAALARIRNK